MSTINERLKAAFDAANISYREFERRTGISRMTLQRYVTGETKKIGIDEVEKMAKALHTTAEFLMGWDDSDEPQKSLEETLKFALFGGGDVTDAQFEEVKAFARFVKERDKNDKKGE